MYGASARAYSSRYTSCWLTGRPAAAERRRPGQARVAAVEQLALPRGVVRAARGPVAGRGRRAVLRDLAFEPGADLGAERLVVVAVAEVHGQFAACASAPVSANSARTAARSTLADAVRGSSSTMRICGGQLVARERAGRERGERVGRHGVGAGPQLDGRDRHRAEPPVGHADHGRAAHLGMTLERDAHVVGADLEAAADDRLVGAPEDPHEAVGVDAGEVGGADPLVAAELAGLHLEQALLVDERRAGAGVDDAQLAPGVRAPDAAALGRPELLVVGEVPARDAAAELGGRVRRRARGCRTSR